MFNSPHERKLLKSVTASCLEIGKKVTDEEYKELIDIEKILYSYHFFSGGKVFLDYHYYGKEVTDPKFVRNTLEHHFVAGKNNDPSLKCVEDFIDATFNEDYKHFESLRIMAKAFIIDGVSRYNICNGKEFKVLPIFKGIPINRRESAKFCAMVVDKIIGELEANIDNYIPPVEFDNKQEVTIKSIISKTAKEL